MAKNSRDEEWTVDKKLAYEEEIARLKKDIDRLQRRNKILVKRVKRLESEAKSLSDELDTVDAFAAPVQEKSVAPNTCPDCGSPLMEPIIMPNGKARYLCADFTNCKYRLTI